MSQVKAATASLEKLQPSRYAQWALARFPQLASASEQAPNGDALTKALAMCDDDAEAMRLLRTYRHHAMLYIMRRDLAGTEQPDILRLLSETADQLCEAALVFAEHKLQRRFGTPLCGERKQRMIVIGMGKLGGRELNFSSDIDLVLAFNGSGVTDGTRQLDSNQYFNRLGQTLIQLLDQRTPDGFCYRVDMRLRPYGDAGRLALSIDAMQDYYQREGRNWERYAWIKARPIAGDLAGGGELIDTLRPFVYRRYLDYSAYEAIREMHRQVRQQSGAHSVCDDLKLGAGGIREIEFIVQTFQLIRGGRVPALRTRHLLQAMNEVARLELLSEPVVERLREAYLDLRIVENRLQSIDDQQTHRLPADAEAQQRLLTLLDLPDWATLENKLGQHQSLVTDIFNRLFLRSEQVTADGPPVLLWRDVSLDQALIHAQAAGFSDGQAIVQRLRTFASSAAVRALDATGRQRLEKFMPRLLAIAARVPSADVALDRILTLAATIVRRSAYIALLNEHPASLHLLVDLVSKSAWIAETLSRQPALLDELIDGRLVAPRLERDQHADQIGRLLSGHGRDLELQMDALRHYQQSNALRIAAARLGDQLSARQTGHALSTLGCVLVEAAGTLARRDIVARHGVLRNLQGEPAELGVIGYGTLGAQELNFDSDLDLVLLHEPLLPDQTSDGERPLDAGRYFMRMAQRWLHVITTLTGAGRLYEVDMRLRPNGQAGFLFSAIDHFETYQQTTAWTWEHQALVRSDWVCGPPELKNRYLEIRSAILGRPRDSELLRQEVRQMRDKMRASHPSRGRNDTKRGAGGLIDLQFVLQYLVLTLSADTPTLAEPGDTVDLLERLSHCPSIGFDPRPLIAAAQDMQAHSQRTALQGSVISNEPVLAEAMAFVERAWQRVFG